MESWTQAFFSAVSKTKGDSYSATLSVSDNTSLNNIRYVCHLFSILSTSLIYVCYVIPKTNSDLHPTQI